jgi:hypothetical protein
MSATTETRPEGRVSSGAAPDIGAALVYLGALAVVVSVIWTTQPLPQVTPGLLERWTTLLLGLALIAASLVGGPRLASAVSGKLLCALGAAVCLSHAIDPTLESLPALAAHFPPWVFDAYPGLPTLGWMLAAVGALIWWAGGGRDEQAGPFRRVTVTCGLVLMAAIWVLRRLLVGAGYDVPQYGSALIAWRVLEATAILVVAMSVCGERRFGRWPLLLFGLGLAGHVARGFIGGGPS